MSAVAGGTWTAGHRHDIAAAASVGTVSSEGLAGEYGSAVLEAALQGSGGDGSGCANNTTSAGDLGRWTMSTTSERSLEHASLENRGVIFIYRATLR